MIYDLREKNGISGTIQACYLVEDSARITSPTFKVYIPGIMSELNQEQQEEYDIPVDKSKLLINDKAEFSETFKTQSFIIAKSAHPYRIRHDGWIPKFKIQKITSTDGTVDDIEDQTTQGTTDGVPMHPPHPITQKFKMMVNKLTSIIFNNLEVFNSTEIDYQELNNKYIKKGHLMYGCFVGNQQNEFIILSIDGAVPYKAQTEPSGNADNPDTSFDAGANNPSN